ncbi:MAG: coenzyme A pyrophosphatase [Saprospiraceae bacterium]|nr:MAG: coenzyme A pyrophosphatase [Saprospiraceae bacterium]
MSVFIQQLRQKLSHPLPGAEAQYKMAHAVRRSYDLPPDTAKLASVLALFYAKASQWHLVLIERNSTNANDRHKGQISFPGGKCEPEDQSLFHTAVREAEEEVGVPAESIKWLGSLTELYIPVSNFLVHPFVGFVDHIPTFTPQLSEVKSILEVPFDYFLDKTNIQHTDMKIGQNITLRQVPYYSVEGKIVWGATAMIISELMEVTKM